MSKTIKLPQVCPLLVFLTLRAVHEAMKGSAACSSKAVSKSAVSKSDRTLSNDVSSDAVLNTASLTDPWTFMPGLKAFMADVDRAVWTAQWAEVTRKSLEKSWQDPLLKSFLNRGSSISKVHKSSVFCLDTDHGWSAQTLDEWVCARENGSDVWLKIPGIRAAWDWWGADVWEDGLRWGAGWLFDPPAIEQEWPSYSKCIAQMGAVIMNQPLSNQWIWPWANLAQQAIEDVFKNGVVTTRAFHLHGSSVFPWDIFAADLSNELKMPTLNGFDWVRLKKAVWEGMSNAQGARGVLEDLLVGIVFDAYARGVFDGIFRPSH